MDVFTGVLTDGTKIIVPRTWAKLVTTDDGSSVEVKLGAKANLNEGVVPYTELPEDVVRAGDDEVSGTVEDGIPVSKAVSLAASAWDGESKQITVSVDGVKADEGSQLIMVFPAFASQADYDAANIKVAARSANSLILSAGTVPSVDIQVYVIMFYMRPLP